VSKDRASPLLKETADSAVLRNGKMRKTNVERLISRKKKGASESAKGTLQRSQ
jgi:hypothetical protein